MIELSKQESDLPKRRVQKMLFSLNSKLLVTASNEGEGCVVTLYTVNKEYYISFHGSFTTDKEQIKTINLLCFSPDNKYLVCADNESHIAVYNIEGDLSPESLKGWSLPQYSCPPTSLAVQKNTTNLVVVYSDHKVN